MKYQNVFKKLAEEGGATLLIFALCLFVFLGVAALAVDIGHLVVTKNELQNAADAAALAGARSIYIVGEDKTIAFNLDCIKNAEDTANLNKSDNVVVDSVEAVRGHWKLFGTYGDPNRFDDSYSDNYTYIPTLINVADEVLDNDPQFINSVKVTVKRSAPKVVSWFAGIFGYDGFVQSADAIGYVGYAKTIAVFKADAPIAICNTAIADCKWARLINDGPKVTAETGGFTDLTQPDSDSCVGVSGTNDSAIREVISKMPCSSPDPSQGANDFELEIFRPLNMINGQANDSFKDLEACWINSTGKNKAWILRLPVIDCSKGFDPNCNIVVSGIEVEVLWLTVQDDSNNYNNVPTSMTSTDVDGEPLSWTDAEATECASFKQQKDKGKCIWENFARKHDLVFPDGTPYPYMGKTVYFRPICKLLEPMSKPGGMNSGILSKDAVLVE